MLRYRDEVGFASNVSENSIARMCFLDFDSLSDVCWPFSTDLKPLFQAAVEEIDNEAQRIKFLGKHLMAVVKIPDMMEQLSQMIVEELQQGAVPEIHWKSASLNEKVCKQFSGGSAIENLQRHSRREINFVGIQLT